ncbi:MAG: hypothetical protein EOO85_25765 [Pedobacter sp.]|nr:MAG: hypothetical protein EOO85_25765 [Pedobacter sp.]
MKISDPEQLINYKMRKLILLLTLAFPLFTLAQKQDTTIFIGAKKIVVKNTATAKDNYTAAGVRLINNGYSIDKKDQEFNLITSQPKEIEGRNYYRQLIFEVIAKDNEIIITPKTKRLNNAMGSLGSENLFEEVSYSKAKLAIDVYTRLSELAKSIGGKIIYSE